MRNHFLRAASGNSGIKYLGFTSSTIDSNLLVLNKPSGVSSGDLMVSIALAEPNVTWLGDDGWTEVRDQGTNPSLRVAYKVAGGSEPAPYDFIASSDGLMGGVIIAYRGAAYDTVGTIATALSGGVQVANAITLSEGGSTVIAVFARTQNTSWSSPSAGLDLINTQTSVRPSWAIYHDMGLPSGSTGTKQATPANTAGSFASVLIGIKRG